MTAPTLRDARALASAVVAGRLAELPPELLTRAGLASAAYATGAAAPAPPVVEAFASAAVQHRRARAALARLLAPCAREGVRVLTFKGFHLAEWVHAHPAERPYGDVDLLIDPDDAAAMAAVARALGWRVAWSRRAGRARFGHEELQLVSPDAQVHVDVHRFAAPCASPFDAVQRRITRAVWNAAEEAVLEGVPVVVPAPVDAAVVGLALNRFWSPDGVTPKPHDYFDLCALRDRHGVTPAALAARARALGCTGTWHLYLRRCDPWRGRLRLAPPGLAGRHAHLAVVACERPHPYVEDVLMRLWRTVGAPSPEDATT